MEAGRVVGARVGIGRIDGERTLVVAGRLIELSGVEIELGESDERREVARILREPPAQVGEQPLHGRRRRTGRTLRRRSAADAVAGRLAAVARGQHRPAQSGVEDDAGGVDGRAHMRFSGFGHMLFRQHQYVLGRLARFRAT